jgi:alpha-L-rhamnosidase
LNRVAATYDSAQGKISSSWEQDSRGLTMRVTIPVGATAKIFVPTTNPKAVFETGTGKRLPADKADFVDFVGLQGDYAVYQVKSGRYTFEVKR